MPEWLFISYSRRDQEFVLRLATDLEDRGAQVWIDQGDIQSGERWRESITRGVQNCKAFVLVVSPDSINSKYVAEELSLALKQRKPIIPLMYRKTDIPAMLNAQLEGYQFLDFRKGGYAQNLSDLVAALEAHGVALHAARELTAEERARRRRQRLGAPIATDWGAVFSKMPGWAFAWGIGWAIFWMALLFASMILGNSEFERFPVRLVGGMAVSGFAGGLIGGLLAGFFTMLALRHNAGSIRWKHMSPAISIWGLVGPIGALAAGAIGLAGFQSVSADCAGLSLNECAGSIIGNAIGNAVLMAFAAIGYAVAALFGIGVVAGWLAVRHIRRLEPGILGRQAIWVVLGWGGGAVAATIGTLMVASLLE